MSTEILAAMTWAGIVEYVQASPYLAWLRDAWFLLLVLIGFSVIIFVHELGHFVLAKLVGIRVETFAVGFGPRLIGWVHNGTDYCLRLLPLGGYVKMMGQEDFAMDQERVAATQVDQGSFLAKTPGQRALVVSGGVVMNVIFAAVAFIIVFMHGLEFPAPIAGRVFPNTPAAAAGIQPGDRFLEVNGERIYHFGGLQLAILTSDPSEEVDLTIERDGKIIHKRVKPRENKKEELLQIGLAGPDTLEVWEPGSIRLGDGPGLKEGDVIVRVDSVTPRQFDDVRKRIVAAAGKPVDLTVERKVGEGEDARTEQVTVQKRAYLLLFAEPAETTPGKHLPTPRILSEIPQENVSLLGLVPRRKFIATPELPDAKADPAEFVQAGDIVVKAGDTVNPTWSQIRDFLDSHRRSVAQIEVIRDGQGPKTVKLYVPWRKAMFEAILGRLGFDDMHLVVSKVLPGTPAAAAGLSAGSTIQTCGGQPVTTWFDLIGCLKAEAGKKAPITFTTADKAHHVTLDVPPFAQWQNTIDYAVDFFNRPMMTMIKAEYPHQAFLLGIRQTWYIIKSVYVTIQRVAFTRTIGVKQLSGPVYIIRQGKEVAEAGFYKLLYYMALISANLAVVNFLPLPVVDGGLIIILLLEKIRGRQMSPRSTAIWQATGLSLIVALFLFVTYNDILKIVRGQ